MSATRRLLVLILAVMATACTSNPTPNQLDPAKSASAFCPSVWARGGEAFFWGSGLSEVETSDLSYCEARAQQMRCYTVAGEMVIVQRQVSAALLAELTSCARWSIQVSGPRTYLIRHDAVISADWHPGENPDKVYVSMKGRGRPLVILLNPEEPLCPQAAEIIKRYSRTLDAIPSCTRQAALAARGLPPHGSAVMATATTLRPAGWFGPLRRAHSLPSLEGKPNRHLMAHSSRPTWCRRCGDFNYAVQLGSQCHPEPRSNRFWICRSTDPEERAKHLERALVGQEGECDV